MSEKSTKYVDAVIVAVNRDTTALRAKLSRADNNSTEYGAWPFLSRWVDLDKSSDKRRSYALVAAAIARVRPAPEKNGDTPLGRALLFVSSDSAQEDTPPEARESARLRRILACQSTSELIDVLRPILRFLGAKGVGLDYVRLLDDIVYFYDDNSRERSKSRWAQEFYSYRGDDQ